jgi:hypothetical protein
MSAAASEADGEAPVRAEPVGRRDVAVAALAGVALAIAMTWPLVLHLGSEVGKDTGDPLLQAWQVAWIGHALLHQPLHFWQANTFWPFKDTLAFTDALVGYAPVGLVAQSGLHAALVSYNLLFLFAYALAFAGAYLLARELGLGWPGAVTAGAAFAYAPWKLSQNGHLHVLSSGGIPLALFLLVRGYRRRSVPSIVGGWLVAAWQLTLGFTLGLQLAYLLLVLAVVAAVAIVRSRLPRPDRGVLVATAVGVGVFALAAVFMARPYLRVVHAHPEARKTVETVVSFSPARRSFLAAPEESWLWGAATSRARAPLAAPGEESLFPGMTIGLLVLVGLFASVYPRRLRIGLALGVAACALFSLGLRDVEGPGRYLTPYQFLFDFAPGWDGVRTPGRINTLTSLGLALLAGAGLCAVIRRLRRRSGVLAGVVGTALVVAILLEGLGPLGHPRVPMPPAARVETASPQIWLPAGYLDDALYSYWSVAGFPTLVNGTGGFDPNQYDRLRKTVAGFPDAKSVAALRAIGVRSVTVYPDRTAGTPWKGAAAKSIAGLPLTRRRVDGIVVFRLR